MSKVKFQLIRVKQGNVLLRSYVNVLHPSKPVTTFIHVPGILGFMDDDSEWVQYLAKNYRFVSYEPREMLVNEQGLFNEYNMKTRILDLWAIISFYSTHARNIVLISSSIGAGVSTFISLLFPELIDALVFLTPKFHHDLTIFEKLSMYSPSIILQVINLLEPLILPFYVDSKKDPKQAAHIKYMLSRTSLVALQKTARQLLATYNVKSYLQKITAPLVIYEAKYDKLHIPEYDDSFQTNGPFVLKVKSLDSQIYSKETMIELERILQTMNVSLTPFSND